MLALYLAIIFSVLLIVLIRFENHTILNADLTIKAIIMSVFMAFIITAFCSLCFATPKHMEVKDVEAHVLVPIDGYDAAVSQDGMVTFAFQKEDGNYETRSIYSDSVYFTTEKPAVPVVAIYKFRLNRPILRHLMFNFIEKEYVISADLNNIKHIYNIKGTSY